MAEFAREAGGDRTSGDDDDMYVKETGAERGYYVDHCYTGHYPGRQVPELLPQLQAQKIEDEMVKLFTKTALKGVHVNLDFGDLDHEFSRSLKYFRTPFITRNES